MKLQDIQRELARLIGEQDARQGGAIVVWHDPDSEFAADVESLELGGIELLREEPNRMMGLKAELNGDLAGRKIVLWRPRARRLEGDWLADVEARAAQFSADHASMQLNELNAADSPEMRETLARHRDFLSKKTNVRRLTKLAGKIATPYQLEVAVVAVELGAASAAPEDVLRALLEGCHERGAAECLGDLGQATLACLGRAVAAWTGYAGELADTQALAQHVLMSSLLAELPQEAQAGLPHVGSADHAQLCHATFETWARLEGERKPLEELCGAAEGALGLEQAVASMDSDALACACTFPCIDAELLRRMFADVISDPKLAPGVLELAGRRRATSWYERMRTNYEGICAAARMQQFYAAHQGGFAGLGASALWDAYASKLHVMDTHYRAFQQALKESKSCGEYDLDEGFRACAKAMENLYKGWYLRELSDRWIDVAEGSLASRGYVEGIARQVDFYASEVTPSLGSARRTWVVISDALRYEVAVQLAGALEGATKGTCELTSMQAALPSVTMCGMAALLPHGSYAVAEGTGGVKVLVDGHEASTTPARQAQLRTQCGGAVAITYDEFVNEMGRAERKELCGEASLVYVYHNTIDAIGDKSSTERKVFQACDEAVDELCDLVRLIVREFGAGSVTVTADHGFLYTDEPLGETEHLGVGEVGAQVVKLGRRYAITRGEEAADELVDVPLPAKASAAGGEEPTARLHALMPRSCVRISMGGDGENYVHGGITLQEMCVPVLRFSNRRAGSVGYVETSYASLSVVSAPDVVSNNIFSVELLQGEPVGGKVLACEYEVFVGDDAHTPLSGSARLVADRADAEAQARRFALRLSLLPAIQTSDSQTYHLFAKNATSGEVTTLHDLRICVAFAPPVDFDW